MFLLYRDCDFNLCNEFSKKIRYKAMDEQKENKRIEVVELSVSELNHNFPNPRKELTKARREELEASLTKLGDFGVIVIDENHSIISGNQRCKILFRLDPDRKVLCKKLIGYSESEKKAINISANNHAGEWDVNKLAEWTKDLVVNLGLNYPAKSNKDIKIKDMEPIRYEKYDYVLIVCKTELDYQSLTRLLKLDDKKVVVSQGKNGTRKIKARAIWYDDVDFILKKK